MRRFSFRNADHKSVNPMFWVGAGLALSYSF